MTTSFEASRALRLVCASSTLSTDVAAVPSRTPGRPLVGGLGGSSDVVEYRKARCHDWPCVGG